MAYVFQKLDNEKFILNVSLSTTWQAYLFWMTYILQKLDYSDL